MENLEKEKIDNDIPLSEYPRMQFKRDSYFCLNGSWNFEISKNEEVDFYTKKIIVPYPVESSLSKVTLRPKTNEYCHYEKTFTLNKDFIKDITILHFGAVDKICDVYLNNNFVGSHKGGYLPFSFNITNYLNENDNVLKVRVKDDQDKTKNYAYGKQKIKRGGIWYTPVTGIWQTVFIESFNYNHFDSIKITPNIDNGSVLFEINGNISEGDISITLDNTILNYHFTKQSFEITLDSFIPWTPDNPHLYYFSLTSKTDTIHSYFAMRKLSIGILNNKSVFLLNNKPYFFNGILDQGYYADGIYTPSSYDEMKKEILFLKKVGFNTLRKHIKIEPLYFYYLCDKLGIIVWQDMVNSGCYSFIKDTLLPTIGFLKKNDQKLRINKVFEYELKETVNHLYNTPSIALWTIFNEGWGQHNSKYYYNVLKKLDPTRLIDHASGWFDQGISDTNSKHIYFRKVKYTKSIEKDKRAFIISEFGGYSLIIDGHTFSKHNSFGYKSFKTKDDLTNAIIKLYENEIIPLLKEGLTASIYTQISDVEDEVNGLLTYDRKIVKVDIQKLNKTLEKLKF